MNADINLTKRELCFIKDEAATWKNKCETLELKVEILSVESRKEGSKIKDLGKQIQEHLSTVRTCNHQVEELQKALADKNQQTILLQSDTSQLAIQHQKEMERLQRQLNQVNSIIFDYQQAIKYIIIRVLEEVLITIGAEKVLKMNWRP